MWSLAKDTACWAGSYVVEFIEMRQRRLQPVLVSSTPWRPPIALIHAIHFAAEFGLQWVIFEYPIVHMYDVSILSSSTQFIF